MTVTVLFVYHSRIILNKERNCGIPRMLHRLSNSSNNLPQLESVTNSEEYTIILGGGLNIQLVRLNKIDMRQIYTKGIDSEIRHLWLTYLYS